MSGFDFLYGQDLQLTRSKMRGLMDYCESHNMRDNHTIDIHSDGEESATCSFDCSEIDWFIIGLQLSLDRIDSRLADLGVEVGS